MIFTDAQNYTILVERDKVEEKIRIPVEDYKFLEKFSLKGDPIRIFNFLRISEDGYLELKGMHNSSTEVIEHGEMSLPSLKAWILLNILNLYNFHSLCPIY